MKIWARLEKQSYAARRRMEQQRQQRAVRQSQQQRAEQCQQQYWVSLCEGDSRGRTGNRLSLERAECANPRISAAPRTEAHQTRPVFRRASAGNEYASGAGAGNIPATGYVRSRASVFQPGMAALKCALALLFLVTSFFGATERLMAEQGIGNGSAISGFFTVDTRLSGSASEGVSGLFTVDTTGANVGNAMFAGYVTDGVGASLAGATVSALQNNIVRAQVGTDASGYYQVNALPAGTYQLRAEKVNYLTGLRSGISLSSGQTKIEHFALAIKPPGPVVQTVIREQEPANLPSVSGTQLKVFVDGEFVTGGPFNSSKPTVILTHGWNSNPEIWAKDMATKMINGGANANILAWDWNEEAGTGLLLSKALSAVPREGEKLGQTLAATFTASYNQPIHFIGHSLGTLVNAQAANYLHERTGGVFDWLREKTQMTLLDNAALANVEGTVVQLGYTLVGVYAPYEVGSIFSIGWLSPVPRHRAWIDNYMSLVGVYYPSAINIWLAKSSNYGDKNNPINFLTSVHNYAARWYGYTAATPQEPLLGNRFSYEQLGSEAQFPSPSPFPLGSLFSQNILSAGELDIVPLQNPVEIEAIFASQTLNLGRFGVQSSVNFAVGVAQKVGAVAVEVAQSFIPHTPPGTPIYTGTAGSTPAYYTENGVEQLPAWSFQVNLQTTPPTSFAPAKNGEQSSADGGASGELPGVWIPVAIPTNAAVFSFDFTFDGEPGEDILSANIGGTNVFALEAKFMPTNTILNSGPVDVTAWAGQTVELFFGVLGGTSTNANVTLSGMRFYYVEQPVLAAKMTNGNLTVSWPITATGYSLEFNNDLSSANGWISVTNPPALIGMENVLTNSVSDGSRFYRLRK